MLRLLSGTLLLMMLLVQTPLHQVLKVYVLVEHYFEHKSKDGKLTVGEFLAMHYAHSNVKDADHSRDMQLPFKTCNHLTFTFTFPQGSTGVVASNIWLAECVRPLSLYRSPYHTSETLSNIWQPPRA